ncbi:MAG: FKBP-type peptidyl-prolyl cis-trans isomerase [Bacteroidetes bacterium]|nr:FKBP-type peptidyl-prolyl cis-trans isomerase [Bacteroidota bacterium]
MRNSLYFLLILFVFSACKTYSEDDKINFDKTIKNFIKKNDLSLVKTSSGLYKKRVSNGDGQIIHYTDSVSITYQGKLLNGKQFDYQTKPKTMAVRDLIAGWKEVLIGARKGDEWMMIIPPQLGYGQNKLDDIPENSILVFKMKIEDVK